MVVNNIIDDPKDLIKLSQDQLTELLLDKYNNSALLRELIRRLLSELKLQKELQKKKDHDNYLKLTEIQEQILEIFDMYMEERNYE